MIPAVIGIPWFFLSLGHLCVTIEYGKAKKLPGFVTLILTIAMFFVWPLFAIGMCFRGYNNFLYTTVPEWNGKQ